MKSLRRARRIRDATLRAIAAQGLGTLGAKEAVPELTILLGHGMNEAAVPIAKLCDPDQCQALLAKVGELPFGTFTEMCDALLFRSAEEVPDAVKIQAVDRMRSLSTPAAAEYLQSLQKRWPKGGSADVENAIDRAVEATRGARGE